MAGDYGAAAHVVPDAAFKSLARLGAAEYQNNKVGAGVQTAWKQALFSFGRWVLVIAWF